LSGIGARDGFVVDMRWQDGGITSVTVRSVGGTQTRLKFGKHVRAISLQAGKSITLTPGSA
jgi:alpha-L-fucosidase 2